MGISQGKKEAFFKLPGTSWTNGTVTAVVECSGADALAQIMAEFSLDRGSHVSQAGATVTGKSEPLHSVAAKAVGDLVRITSMNGQRADGVVMGHSTGTGTLKSGAWYWVWTEKGHTWVHESLVTEVTRT